MKYRHFVSAQPVPNSSAQAGSLWATDPAAAEVHALPPTLHFVGSSNPHVERFVHSAVAQASLSSPTRRQLIEAVQAAALQMGYAATVQASMATASGMPSFPGVTVGTTVLLIDLVPG
jgi:hypothetical protein